MTGRLVLCLDGTWNNPFIAVERDDKTTVMKPTNPLKLARAILPEDPKSGARQITYYDSGVGALGLYPGISNRLLNFFDSKLGGAWGAGYEANIEQAVTFISNNYIENEQIFIFGFSRGAAQVRGLTQFLSWLGGVTEKKDAYYIPIFFRLYLTTRGKGDPRTIVNSKKEIIADRLRPVEITFLGVWDTVVSLGSRFRARSGTSVAERSFHVHETPAKCVRVALQALAIDEKRYDFRPEVWKGCDPDQTLEQRWFPGAHGNVGGSYGNDGMANCALHWIVEKAVALGLAVDEKFLRKYRSYPQDTMGETYTRLYQTIDRIRFRYEKGIRPLTGYPPGANLSIDPCAIKRLCSNPDRHPTMSGPYRPKNLVELVRRHKDDKEGFIRSFGLDPETYPFPDDI
ncbi:phospholipase effector Tle1 domain-containing protein [Roseibium sp. M-1]